MSSVALSGQGLANILCYSLWSGVHSAMQHDMIMKSGHADAALVEQEAVAVAAGAVSALRRSRSRCRAHNTGVPTWTGLHGTAGAPR